ncbi:MAG TPA: zinc-ribbon and DUF3426 domain-containing protein [Pusillimonas sp.]|uniref:zinc-ribbon and DUF3426 domain-containing protein n=1 Tax=unclassified Pusillimonas TaxID=2640016 RepID=UPI00262F0D22|nr:MULTISPECIES: zinc-ribbon and DUF3426 domain-containing protein [unclassified Pusillimonas]HLU19602.1 zinc-ribbon and DUF3426 domain-containing protein [Pusillimonas sp.]
MDLTTRCPQCLTEFPVSLQQLQLRKGYVRCINCAHIFDAYEAVVPAAPVASPTQPPRASEEAGFSVSASAASPTEPRFVVSNGKVDSATEHAEPSVSIRVRSAPADSTSFTVRDHHLADDGTNEPIISGRDPVHSGRREHSLGDQGAYRDDDIAQRESGLYVEPRAGREAGPEFIHDDERSGIGIGGILLSLLVVLGVVAALLQLAYIYRVQLANEFPGMRPALERYCDVVGCTVDYPRRIALIAIMDSSLQAVRDPGNADKGTSRLMLNVVLRNNYEKPQQWPNLAVELVDFSGTVAVRRSLTPADYLPEISRDGPFPGKSEVRITVPIEVRGVQINGYQLDKFFP